MASYFLLHPIFFLFPFSFFLSPFHFCIHMAYGRTQADWGNAVLRSFCLVYCKACSTLTKTGIKYIFSSRFKAKWSQYAHSFILSADHLVWSKYFFENSPQSRNFKIQFILEIQFTIMPQYIHILKFQDPLTKPVLNNYFCKFFIICILKFLD